MIYTGRPYVMSPYQFRHHSFEPNEVGNDILGFITTSPTDSTLDALVTHLTTLYDVDRATLEADACAFIDDCIQRDILLNSDLKTEGEMVVENIHETQKEIPELTVDKFGYRASLGGPWTPGCQSCSRGKWAVFSVGIGCNLDCWFCPYTEGLEKQRVDRSQGIEGGIERVSFMGMRFSFQELKLQFSLIHDKFDAFAWIGGEPMMPQVLNDTLPMIRYFHETYPDYHQWMYTNGSFATTDNLKRLHDAGIRELRFNLGAVGFNRKVIARMKEAKQIFPYVCLEIPMTKKNYEGLMSHYQEVLDTGLDQMNLAEFIVGRNHVAADDDLKEEGKLYSFKGFISSPIASRQYTYEVIKKAVAEKWPVVINDCSNEYKYYKLSIQEVKGVNIFQGRVPYWNNGYRLREIDDFNDRLPETAPAATD